MIGGQPPEHDADHRETDEGDGGASVALEVPGETTTAADPGEGAFHNPALGQDLEAFCGIGSLHDLQLPCSGVGDDDTHLLAAITAVGEDAFDEGKQPSRPAQQFEGAVAILDVGGKNDNAQQQTQGVDEDVPFAALDLLARVVARSIEQSPPFCAPLALWLSMIAVVGLASRPACSRTAT